MSDSRVPASEPGDRRVRAAVGAGGPDGKDRRQHQHLRDLIDEMLASLRAAVNRDLFTKAERADAEEQLARIMALVHAEALEVGDHRGGAGRRKARGA